MLRRIWIWIIVSISILLLLGIGIFLLYYFLEVKNWPLVISLEALDQDAQVSLYMNSTEVQQLICKTGGRFASRLSVGNVLEDNPTWVTATDIITRNGTFDTGVGLEKYAEIRNAWPPTLQAFFTGELSVQEVLDLEN